MKHKIRYILLIAAFFLLFVYSVYAEERPEFDSSSVIVVMKPKSDEISLFAGEDIFDGLEISEIENLDEENTGEISLKLTLSESDEENVLSAIEALNEMDEVEYAQPNYYYYLEDMPNDRYYMLGYQYNLSKIGAEYVWSMDIDCSETVVAVLDSGMMMTHDDLADNLWTNPGEIAGNGKDDDGNGYIDDVHGWDFGENDNSPYDYNGHGTHVAGIISAVTDNKIGVASLARNVKIVPIKIFDDDGNCTSEYLYKAMRYVSSMGFPIANCSWGTSSKDNTLKKRMKECSDTVFTVAAGNAKTGKSATDNDVYPLYPASFGLSNIISVASTDSSDNLSTFSNYGSSSVDIAAPGTGIYSTYNESDSSYKTSSGTSMAAPLVASAAAVIKAACPELSAEEIINYILDGADTVSALKDKVNGSRRLNAYNSLSLAAPTPTPTPSPTPSPTPIPTPKPTPMPEAKEAELTSDGDTVTLTITFDDDEAPDLDEVKAYAVYKEKESGLLIHAEDIHLTDNLTAEFTDQTDDDCDLEVYIWSKNMQPLCGVLRLERKEKNNDNT